MSYKILHISTSDQGGAGLAALRLHMSLLHAGVESHMLVAHKSSKCDSVVEADPPAPWFVPSKNKMVRFLQIALRKTGYRRNIEERYRLRLKRITLNNPPFYTLPVSSYNLSKHPLVQQADIIHLHWIQDFVDYPSFFAQVHKPIVWTIHDLNPLMGGFHHFRLREQYYKRYKRIENELCRLKLQSVSSCRDLTVIAISHEMSRLIGESLIFKGRQKVLISNSVNSTQFILIPKNEARKALGIEASRVYLFINWNINDSEKGLPIAIKALEQLNPPDTLLLCVGYGDIPPTHILTRQLQPTPDTAILSLYYSCADLLLFPSYQEAFPQTTMESLCCGTPVVMTPVSGASEQINPLNGVISADHTPEAFADAIRQAITHSYVPEAIRNDIAHRFAPETIANQYISIYNNIFVKK